MILRLILKNSHEFTKVPGTMIVLAFLFVLVDNSVMDPAATIRAMFSAYADMDIALALEHLTNLGEWHLGDGAAPYGWSRDEFSTFLSMMLRSLICTE